MRLFVAMLGTVFVLAHTTQVAHAAEKHLFYVHGCCVKDKDDPKAKAYGTIVQALRDSGFQVAFELRPIDVSDSEPQVRAFAARLAEKTQALIANGVAPEDITIAGYSLGSITALVASGLIGNPRVNFVLLAGCPIRPAVQVDIDYSKVRGRVLAILDAKDDKYGSCRERFPAGVVFQELVLNSGEGHAVFRLPEEKFLKLWKEPLVQWAEGK